MLTEGGGGVQEPLIWADVICEQPLMGLRRRGRGKAGARAAAKKTWVGAKKRGLRGGECGEKEGAGVLRRAEGQTQCVGGGEPYCTMINDGMEAHRDEHTHSIRPRLQQGAVEMRRSSGGGGDDDDDDDYGGGGGDLKAG